MSSITSQSQSVKTGNMVRARVTIQGTRPLPFPANINRNVFGQWLSGFTDGEGYFCLCCTRRPNRPAYPVAHYGIRLRADDLPVLQLIRSFFGVGSLRYNQPKGGNLQVEYAVVSAPELLAVVVPHFEQFPLFAKKSRDFQVWKQGVALIAAVSSKKVVTRGSLRGSVPKWTPAEMADFCRFDSTLKELRKFPS